MISTANDHEMVTQSRKNSSESILKPQSVLDYNKNARGIDQSDSVMKFYSMKRKSLKWYKKIFFHVIDMCMYNSFVIYKSLHGNCSFLNFKTLLVRDIMNTFGCNETKLGAPTLNHPLRLSGRHFLEFNPPTKGRSHGQRNCVVCTNTIDNSKRARITTVYQCKICKVPLCPVYCNERYHSIVHY